MMSLELTWSSYEPWLDFLSNFFLKYHCEAGSENCDSSCDARPENRVSEHHHLSENSGRIGDILT